jgi:sortase A
MTLVRGRREVEVAEPSLDDASAEDDPVVTPRRRGRRWRRAIATVVVVLIATGLIVALFQGPVQSVWYRNRQHQLAADMNHARPRVSPGQASALLQVPRLGINVVVIEGDNAERLRDGPGRRVGSARPGARGNTVIMGHSSAWGGPFSDLNKVRRGDLIAVQTRARAVVVYRVTATANVGGASSRLLGQTKDHRLTLVTGRGGTLSDDRFVVTAVSGTAARASTDAVRLTTPSGSVIFNVTLLAAIIAFGLGAGAVLYLRRRAGPLAVGVAVVPLLALGALLLMLDLDLLLPPLN